METLAELFSCLDAQLDQQTKTAIAFMSEVEANCALHFGINALMRSLAFHQNESLSGKEFFHRFGMPDDASHVFGLLYWHRLRGDPITADLVIHVLSKSWSFFEDGATTIAEQLVLQLSD